MTMLIKFCSKAVIEVIVLDTSLEIKMFSLKNTAYLHAHCSRSVVFCSTKYQSIVSISFRVTSWAMEQIYDYPVPVKQPWRIGVNEAYCYHKHKMIPETVGIFYGIYWIVVYGTCNHTHHAYHAIYTPFEDLFLFVHT